MANPRVGVQLNPAFGERRVEDLAGVLREVSAAGFDGVEAEPLCGGDVRAAGRVLGDHGLVQWSVHIGIDTLDDIGNVIDYIKALGGRFVVVSGAGANEPPGLRPYEQAAVALDRAGERCRAAGMTLCYHNHGWEFREYGGTTGLERLLETSDTGVVKLCIDVFWVLFGGRDPVELLRRYLDRVAFVHLKDLRYVVPRHDGPACWTRRRPNSSSWGEERWTYRRSGE